MQLIGYPFAGRATAFRQCSTYHLISAGLRIGISEHADITGNQGVGRGARVIYDTLGSYAVNTSTGRGASRLYKVTRAGKGKRARFVRKLGSKRNSGRGSVLGQAARGAGLSGADHDLDRAAMLDQFLHPIVDRAALQASAKRLQQFGAVVFSPTPGVIDQVRADWRAAIVAQVDQEHTLGNRLLIIAVRAARGQAERLEQLRGVRASATSIDDASSAAAQGILASVRRVDKAPDRLWHNCGASGAARCKCNVCQSHARFVRVLSLYAGRAAFKSLASWANVGTTGDNTCDATGFTGRAFVDEFTTAIADQLSIEQWHNDDRIWFDSERAARWRAVRWIYQVGYRNYCANVHGKGSTAARRQARARCRVIGSIVFGASLIDACAHAGFASVEYWIKSCKAACLFDTLRNARARTLDQVPSIEYARGMARAFAIDAGQAARDLQAFGGLGAWSDCIGTDTQRARGWRGASAARRVIAQRAIVGELADSINGAHYWRARAARSIQANLRAFDRVLAGINGAKFGDLRTVFGMVDKLGRARSRAVDPSMISRARGKLARKPVLARTVQVQVNSRSIACAPSVSAQAWAQAGDQGFSVVKARQ